MIKSTILYCICNELLSLLAILEYIAKLFCHANMLEIREQIQHIMKCQTQSLNS